ncbi:hypothetical protein ACK8HX_02825 [Oryzobacter sp. R7]|uniref:hypothetical protein n=1 Tax=Oryzobacter faecalis TaxID=3388656 RepID=UPI00398CE786
MARLPAQFVPQQGAPAPEQTRAARAWAVATGLGVFLSMVVGEGVASALGVPEGGIATPAKGAVVLAVVAVLVLAPLAMAWRAAGRTDDPDARLAAIVATALGGGFLVLNVCLWLVGLASLALDRI